MTRIDLDLQDLEELTDMVSLAIGLEVNIYGNTTRAVHLNQLDMKLRRAMNHLPVDTEEATRLYHEEKSEPTNGHQEIPTGRHPRLRTVLP